MSNSDDDVKTVTLDAFEPLPPPISTPPKQNIKKLLYKPRIHYINSKFTTKFKKPTRKFGNTRHLTRKFGNTRHPTRKFRNTTQKNTMRQITYKRRKNKKPTPYMQNTIKILQLPSYLTGMLREFTKFEKKQFYKFKQQGSIRGMRIMIIKKYNKLNPNKRPLKYEEVYPSSNLPPSSGIPANAVTKY
jgi:hypothetical protein